MLEVVCTHGQKYRNTPIRKKCTSNKCFKYKDEVINHLEKTECKPIASTVYRYKN